MFEAPNHKPTTREPKVVQTSVWLGPDEIDFVFLQVPTDHNQDETFFSFEFSDFFGRHERGDLATRS